MPKSVLSRLMKEMESIEFANNMVASLTNIMGLTYLACGKDATTSDYLQEKLGEILVGDLKLKASEVNDVLMRQRLRKVFQHLLETIDAAGDQTTQKGPTNADS